MIVIIDYNVGNVGSIKNMISKLGYECIVSKDPNIISNAEKIILPGVGSFDNGMQQLIENNLIEILNNKVIEKKTPFLGICLGMQLMAKGSEEGVLEGLGWIDSIVKKINPEDDLNTTIPIMGWNYVCSLKENRLIKGNDNKFYFVHSFYFPKETLNMVGSSTVGKLIYCSMVVKDNIYGVQFHPEKSHSYGLQLLNNFCSL
jgi:glutamine amidotransferase